MGRRLVWLATMAVAASVLVAGAASAQYRGYGDGYGAAPDYYQGGPYGGGDAYGGRGGYYGDPGYGPPPNRYRQEQSYDYGQGPYAAPRGYAPPRGDQRDAYGSAPQGYGDGYDQGPAPQPYYADPGAGGGAGGDPGHKASDLDLREGSQEATRTEVENPTKQPPGTIVIDTASRHLYLVEKNGQAMQYGIGVGREGFAWKGVAHIQRKSEWPDWIPPSDMLKRRPDLPTRMAGGIENPLGARAMYLFQGNKDTMFRIHGTNEPDSIGKAMSSGCIRMMNNDVIDLYSRVPVGTKVVVL